MALVERSQILGLSKANATTFNAPQHKIIQVSSAKTSWMSRLIAGVPIKIGSYCCKGNKFIQAVLSVRLLTNTILGVIKSNSHRRPPSTASPAFGCRPKSQARSMKGANPSSSVSLDISLVK